MDILSEINDKISALVKAKQKIGIALSGGADSMVMLELFLHYTKTHDNTLFAINIDHSIRGRESEADSLFVKEYCLAKKVPLFFKKIDAPALSKEGKMTLEEAARVARYGYFEQLCAEGQVDMVATAHHLDDQIETVLMRLHRGVGIKGLEGIKAKVGNYIRPLLTFTKNDLLSYAKKNNIPYVTDSTNLDTRYTRNFFRQEIIPFLTSDGDMAKNSFYTTIKNITTGAQKLNSLLEKFSDCVSFDGSAAFMKIELLKSGDLFAKTILDKSYTYFDVFKDIESRHLRGILQLTERENGKFINMPFGLTAYKEYEYITLCRRIPPLKPLYFDIVDFEQTLKSYYTYAMFYTKTTKIDNRNLIDNMLCDLRKKQPHVPKNTVLRAQKLLLDIDKLPKKLCMRGRRNGDIFQNVGASKKLLSDFLSQNHLPQRLRDSVRLICDGNEVLLIDGYAVSDRLKIDKDTTNVLLITYGQDKDE